MKNVEVFVFVGTILWFPSCIIYNSYRERWHTESNMRRSSQTRWQTSNQWFYFALSEPRQMSHREHGTERKLSLSAVFVRGVCPTSTPLNPVWQVLRSASLFPVSAAVRLLSCWCCRLLFTQQNFTHTKSNRLLFICRLYCLWRL